MLDAAAPEAADTPDGDHLPDATAPEAADTPGTADTDGDHLPDATAPDAADTPEAADTPVVLAALGTPTPRDEEADPPGAYPAGDHDELVVDALQGSDLVGDSDPTGAWDSRALWVPAEEASLGAAGEGREEAGGTGLGEIRGGELSEIGAGAA